MNDPFLEAVAALQTEFPGYYVENVRTGGWSGSHDRDGNHKADVGWYRAFDAGNWYVTVQQEGWSAEAYRIIVGRPTPAEAVVEIADHLRVRRDDPHSAHIEDKELVLGCDGCLRDCRDLEIDPTEMPMVLG